MRKKLEEQIAEGIDKSIFGQFFKGFLYAIIIIGSISLLLFVGRYFTDPCKDGVCVASIPVECSLPYIYCHLRIGNQTEETTLVSIRFCGYQEAEAYSHLNIPNVHLEDLKGFNEYHKTNFTIKDWMCEN